MSGRNLKPEQITSAITLREAGYTLTAIAEKIGVSVSSLQRTFKRHTVKKGGITAEAVQNARDALLSRITSSETIKTEVAKLVADDLAHTTLLREKAAIAIESLNPKDTTTAALTMRALVAYSTLLKNTSDTVRRSIGVDKNMHDGTVDELPELVVSEMTAEEIIASLDEARKNSVS